VKALFADSFYFLALLRLEDSTHARAIAASQNRTERLVTTAWILTEVADALAVPAMREGFPRLLAALQADPACKIVPPTQDFFDRGVELYVRRPDKGWSLTDCISFVVMWENGMNEALTGDRHFEQAGFIALLK
jgi:predicted nucleic acid-binding protein